ncbi:tRNA-lysidine synthetase [Coprinopsis marcescibilis]|uniref:tRNA(Ile)-lysidine synthetase n=1 Tax=Coprinopsis marcescibilis TaxID=230819 RepID=A0A5C3LBR1_COPMA|nr:tRNA-lysidine synthetase [Coprinopsis marcescibilis]
MAAHCAEFAKKLGIEHRTTKIRWGEDGNPQKPTQAFEQVAREARYDLLLDALRTMGSNIIAFGHHADDQVETALMRLGKGSSILGARGMRRISRWGMRSTPQPWHTVDMNLLGMNTWIIRPLLSIPKDAILATCEARGLEYVTDQTNFQPDLTIRNAIRQYVAGTLTLDDIKQPAIRQDLLDVQKVLLKTPEFGADLTSGPMALRKAVKGVGLRETRMASDVDHILSQCRLPSPVGTILLSQSDLMQYTLDPTLSMAFIRRILRYLSPEPWGSLRAELRQRSKRSKVIVRNLFTPITANSLPFVSGSRVMWTPVVVRGGKIKDVASLRVHRDSRSGQEETLAWMASRQPEARKNEGLYADEIEKRQGQEVHDILSNTLKDPSRQQDTVEVLWDYRYRIRYTLGKMPSTIASHVLSPDNKVVIQPYGKWYSPRVVLKMGKCGDEVELAKLEEGQAPSQDWIKIDFIRSLDRL